MTLMGSYYGSSTTRGLWKRQLGGVIFGTNETTINECLSKKLFGLPSPHFVYVKKIEPGLPLFLFNYTNRTLLGIFEAASSGQMNIDPCAWTCEGSQKTPYPAQVVFTEKEVICMKLKELALNRKLMAPLSADCKDESIVSTLTVEKKEDSLANSSKTHPMISQLILKVQELMASKVMKKAKINHLKEKMAFLQQKLAEAQAEIKKLKGMCNMSELETYVGPQEYSDLKANEVSLVDDPILLVGGYDGGSWLSSLDCYSPSQNLTKSLNPINTERCYAAVSKVDGELYVFGGGTCGQWFDTVEYYNPVADRWTTCPPLNRKNGSLAGATVNDKIYAVGGRNGVDCYSTVEMLDFDVGSWIPARSMLEKRFALAAAELNGALYAVGGYDGKHYLR
ncbi:hypothetical protein L1987_24650 [Smallanthus sonchifolius]|uniref:Uncharacterized protein n=1 Tax=Smallanthus sonchifolius TaxID=185202 RepID=A0ACB9INP3_9ASTR|nr:hypothetical protein L1987_24650 [Smallanthus sonchifolius]